MLKPLLIEPKKFIGTKLNKIKIDNIDEKKELIKKFYLEHHNNDKESNIVINNLLKKLFYEEENYIISEKDGFNNQKGLIDLSIKDKNKEIPKNEILIEIKKPNDHDMITRNDFYKKSFYQAIYYYLSDKKENNNKSEIKFLIITDSIKWFFIKTIDLEDAIFDKQDVNQKEIYFNLTNDNTDMCYEEIKKYLEKINVKITNDSSLFDYGKNVELPFTFFHLGDIIKQDDYEKMQLFIKCISDANLLNKVDVIEKNTLNKKFYKELLYIIGLEEKKDKKKIILERINNNFSLISLIKKALEDKDIIFEENELKEKSLELSLLWINRLLFIQLFSSILEKYKVIKEPILNIILNKKSSKYTAVYNLFFDVLNLPKEDRRHSKMFENIPYINSSLFQLEDIEKDITIKELDDCCYAALYKDTNIDRKYDNELNILEYFIHFLNSYNIAVDENFMDNSDKDLINASVLGKIFEKINGYKDGSFYTPSYITEFMANDSIKNIVISKFNERNFVSKDINSLRKEIYIDDRQKEAIEIFNTLRVCDPAVGSGHFLVSTLNSMLLYKCKLGLFESLKPNQLEVIDDSLIINNIDDYSINEANKNNHIQKIYEEIYSSKKEIIKNSIFGVDLNPKSVKISRLRLWIELLKHTYFTSDSNYKELELLPNIDINIKEGNSLISKYPLSYNFDKDLFDNDFFYHYKHLVNKYKDSRIKSEKKEILKELSNIKNLIARDNDKSFEWRYEFPEVLDENGNFLGFDLIIGNPPYSRIQNLQMTNPYEAEFYKKTYMSSTNKYDIYVLFLEKGFELLKQKSKLTYILPHNFLITQFGKGIRKFLLKNSAVESILHFGSNKVFEDASTYTCIITLSQNNLQIRYKELKPCKVTENIEFEEIDYCSLSENPWSLSNSNILKVLNKLKTQPFTADDVFEHIFQGLQGNGDEKDILKGEIIGNKFYGESSALNKQVILEQDIVVPILKSENVTSYLISKPTHYTIYPHFLNSDNKTVPFEEEEFMDKYPLAYQYLSTFKDELKIRKVKFKTNPKYWYGLHRPREIPKFKTEKIITPEIVNKGQMALDTNGYFHGSTIYSFVKKESDSLSYKYYLGILNSSVMYFFIKNTSPQLSGGYSRYKTTYMKPFPMPHKVNKKTESSIIELVNKIEKAKQEESSTSMLNYNEQLDNEVFKLYNLSQEEIGIIQNNI
ncbi:hypothetical protein CRV00_05665 [Malaciobacter molluscorum]|uniref:Eco57I restriction-modification methylase domain-containing protein n=1 Tax=Malaciobacter molluscorum TaxID=1032072 RepID=UPI00100AC0D0|nr:TaqI-like C-terminal specificity domain-containing protein [Malaciobacter molluscorum]RXJ94819.1 hypothetical protein CRV00_05665 [Malaciobacter molluscorum]